MAGLLLVAAAGCQGDEDGPPSGDRTGGGPIELAQDMTNLLAPITGPTFFAIPACGSDGPVDDVEIVSLAPLEVSGGETITFTAAWPGPDERLKLGAGRLEQLEEPFGEAVGSRGSVAGCGEGLPTLEFAVQLPEAVDRAVVVDGFEVTYETGGRRYTASSNVELGVCGSDPVDPDEEPEDCDW
ncbi:hypothetical protein [Nocardioides donggukensis]|uniref:Uncharacterized protein n=1 Tax=Nocardioides donggukensis TaxID=2774019 RepID=A0A927K4U8_9ACTN|nr:hypothetical protein [Nocardioides donggukensis]MBD8869901.1 hypothetical protein [Nocardioides donggukensis]